MYTTQKTILKNNNNIKIHYKLNYNKILRNISILLLITLIIIYIKVISANTSDQLQKVSDFTDYAKSSGISLTQANYKEFIK